MRVREWREFVYFNGKRIAFRTSALQYRWYLSDHLGSSRKVISAAAGNTYEDADFYPFGGERSLISTSGNSYKFTGKERDPETNLDYFGARYYAFNFGRFTTPDEFAGGPVDAFSSGDPLPPGPLPYADITNPQSLNKYTYTYNNPLRYTDPNGHCAHICVGALIGGGIGLGIEAFHQIKEGKLNVAKLASKTVQGAVVGAVAAATGGASLIVQAGAVGTANAVAGTLSRAVDNDPNTKAADAKATGLDLVVGAAGGAAGRVVGSVVKNDVLNSASYTVAATNATRDLVYASTPAGAEAAQQALATVTARPEIHAAVAEIISSTGTEIVLEKVGEGQPKP